MTRPTCAWRRVAASSAAVAAAACGGDRAVSPAAPSPAPAAGAPARPVTFRLVAGVGVADSALALLADPLVVEVRDANGQPVKGVVVRFEAGPTIDTTPSAAPALYVCRTDAARCGPDGSVGGPAMGAAPAGGSTFAADTSDAAGRARARVRLGAVAGRVVARVSVPEYGLTDTVGFGVGPGAPARVRLAYADTALAVGARATVRASAFDRWGNARPEVPTLSAAENGAVSFDAATGYVAARDFGTAYLRARDGAAADSASVRVLPTGRLVGYDAGLRRVQLIDFDGGNARPVLAGVRLGGELGLIPRFDPSRASVSFPELAGTGRAIAAGTVDTAGTAHRTFGPTTDSTQVIAVRRFTDGTARFVVRTVDPASGSVRGTSVWTVNAGGAVQGVRALPQADRFTPYPDVSPDASRVAYVAELPSGATELRVLDLSTGGVAVLEASAASPRWSPSGTQVAFLATRVPGALGVAGSGPLVVMNADGTGRRLISHEEFGAGLAWSPDGAYVVAPADRLSSGPLRVVRVRDGARVVVTLRDRAGTASTYAGAAVTLTGVDWR